MKFQFNQHDPNRAEVTHFDTFSAVRVKSGEEGTTALFVRNDQLRAFAAELRAAADELDNRHKVLNVA